MNDEQSKIKADQFHTAECDNPNCTNKISEGQRYILTADGQKFCGLSCYTAVTGYTRCVVCGSLDAKALDTDGKKVRKPLCHTAGCTARRAVMTVHDKLSKGLPARQRVRGKGRELQQPARGSRPKKRAPKTNGKNKRR